MLVRIILVLLIITAVAIPFSLPYLPFVDVDDPEQTVEKPPFEQNDDETLLQVGTTRFDSVDYQSFIHVTGVTKADKSRNIRSEVNGNIAKLLIQRGDRVEPGDVFATVDAETRYSQIAQAEANLETATADLESTQTLVESGVLPENNLFAAKAGLKAAQTSLDQARQQIKDLAITNTVAGIVTEVLVETGSPIVAGEPVATVLAVDPIKVIARVSEAEIKNVYFGQHIKVELVTGQKFDAKVSYISPLANIATRTFAIEANANNGDYSIRDGVTADVEIARPVEKAFKINQSALVTDGEGYLGVRIVDENSLVDFIPVQLLETTLESAWVTGITSDMQVIVIGQRFAEIGDEVHRRDIADIADAKTAVEARLGEN